MDYCRRAAQFRQSLSTHSEETYVIETNGKLLGFLTIGTCRDEDVDPQTTGEIWGIYLDPSQWRKGIGSVLLREGIQMLTLRNYTDVVLWVFEKNGRATGFYEARGFERDGAVKLLSPGAPLRAIRYRRSLVATDPAGQLDQSDQVSGNVGRERTASGLCFVSVDAGEFMQTKKLMLLK